MRKLHDMLGISPIGIELSKSLIDTNRHIGIEIELEGVSINWGLYAPTLWLVDGDGSLRNYGVELKNRFPVLGKNIIKSINELNKMKTSGFLGKKITHSTRTSTHIHADVTALDLKQISNICMNYILYCESLFFEIGKIKFNRKNNTYCLPLEFNDKINTLYYYYLNNDFDSFIADFGQFKKYHSLNLNTQFGTLELRCLESTTESLRILKWINIYLDFINNSKDIPVVLDAIKNRKQIKEYLKLLFKNTYKDIESFINKTSTYKNIEPVVYNVHYPNIDSKNLIKVIDNLYLPKLKDMQNTPLKIKKTYSTINDEWI